MIIESIIDLSNNKLFFINQNIITIYILSFFSDYV
jgi:hypothetical protein